jgi:hypothetical protein
VPQLAGINLQAKGLQVRDGQRDRLAHRAHDDSPSPFTGDRSVRCSSRFWLGSCRGYPLLAVAVAEIGCVGPRAMQKDSEFASDRDSGWCHATSLRDTHPMGHARPLARPHEQGMSCFAKGGAGKLIAASADLAWMSVSPD